MKLNQFSSAERPTLAKFPNFGDSYSGTIAKEPEWRNDPLNDGQQMLVVVIEHDNGVFYQINGRTQMPDAIRDAVIDADSEELEPGGRLTVTYAKDQGNAKIYTAHYEPPQSEAMF
jgi:hypothetical protein